MEDNIDILTAKALSGEATAEESARLQEMLAGSPELQAEFAELQSAWAILKENGPLADAMTAPPSTPPPERMKKWQAAVAQKSERRMAVADQENKTTFAGISTWMRGRFPRFSLALGAVSLAAILAVALWPSRTTHPLDSAVIAYLVMEHGNAELRRDGKTIPVNSTASLRDTDELRIPVQGSVTLITPNGPQMIAGPRTVPGGEIVRRAGATNKVPANTALSAINTALFQPPTQMLALLRTTRNGQSISIYSPIGFTANLTPPILWKTEPGKTYDISITDEFAPTTAPLSIRGAASPVEFAKAWPQRTLSSNGLYRLQITESGKSLTATELTFRTLPPENATLNSTNQLLTVYQMLTASPARLGDALAVLSNLPAETADSELALRLKLLAFGQLGYEEDFTATLQSLKASGTR